MGNLRYRHFRLSLTETYTIVQSLDKDFKGLKYQLYLSYKY